KDLLERIASSLSIRETYLFGLTQLRDGEHYLIDLNERISKYAPSKVKGEVSKDPSTGFILYFRVQFYTDSVTKIQEDTTRNQYYLQLKKNIVRCYISCTEELCFKLASYALQADFGDFTNCSGEYFDPEQYFPPWVIETRSRNFILRYLPNVHRDHLGMSRKKAKFLYIQVSCVS
ncbi:uncharacterized protein TRIADDRAFT_18577, partial [Trichoplax adhaerens]